MIPAKTDVAVLIIFFNRSDHFKKVFDAVCEARPSKLFLYQDGPRSERDMEGIEECRKIAENIGWECEVHRLYQEKNFGCDPSEYISQKWAFSIVDKCIVLEDDDVPSQSFFPFCKEMLDRYENDKRVWMISGFNIEEVSEDVKTDYFFTSAFSIWGWASWRRVIDTWDDKYSFLDSEEAISHLESHWDKSFVKSCKDHRSTGKEYYETIFSASMILNNGLAIMPSKNMICNIGLEGGTHYSTDLRTLPRRKRRIFTMKSYDMSFPLKHPQYVCEHLPYKKRFFRAHLWNTPWLKMLSSIEELFLNLRYGNFSNIKKAILHRYAILKNKVTHV